MVRWCVFAPAQFAEYPITRTHRPAGSGRQPKRQQATAPAKRPTARRKTDESSNTVSQKTHQSLWIHCPPAILNPKQNFIYFEPFFCVCPCFSVCLGVFRLLCVFVNGNTRNIILSYETWRDIQRRATTTTTPKMPLSHMYICTVRCTHAHTVVVFSFSLMVFAHLYSSTTASRSMRQRASILCCPRLLQFFVCSRLVRALARSPPS